MNQCILVCGPESSCNKLTTQLFCMAGYAGTYTEPQHLNHFVAGREHDITRIIADATHIVYIQSVPGGPIHRPDLPAIKRRFESAGFAVKTVIVLRDWYACCRSKLLNRHQHDFDTAWQALMEEWTYIGQCLFHLHPFFILNTSYLLTNPRRALTGLSMFTQTNFPDSCTDIIKDTDLKYF